MQIKRKTKTEFKPAAIRLRVYAADTAMTGHGGTPNCADELYRQPIGEGELRANADDNAKFGDQIIPELTLTVPGFGQCILSPSEVHRVLIMIEEIQVRARNAATFIGRELSVTV